MRRRNSESSSKSKLVGKCYPTLVIIYKIYIIKYNAKELLMHISNGLFVLKEHRQIILLFIMNNDKSSGCGARDILLTTSSFELDMCSMWGTVVVGAEKNAL